MIVKNKMHVETRRTHVMSDSSGNQKAARGRVSLSTVNIRVVRKEITD